MFKKVMALSVLVVSLYSCKKNDDVINTTTPSKEQLVGTWKQTGETTNGANTWNTTAHQACEMDDNLKLNTDNTYIYTDAGTVCSPSGNDNGTWSVSGSTLSVDGYPLTIDGFNGSTLNLKETYTLGGTTYTVIAVFSKQ
jgi:hypothetical protein